MLNLSAARHPGRGPERLWLEMDSEFAKLAQTEWFRGLLPWVFDSWARLRRKALPLEDLAIRGRVDAASDAAYRLFGYQGAEILDKMTFGQYLVKVTADGTGTGIFNP